MKQILVIFIISISSLGYSQVLYPTDTIIVQRTFIDDSDSSNVIIADTVISKTPFGTQVLVGTTILSFTDNQQVAKGYGLYLKSVELTPCDKNESARGVKNRIINIEKTDSSWFCTLKIVGNCCHDFLCDISVKNDSILNFIYYGYGVTRCSCSCCFGLTYKMDIEMYDKLSSIKYAIINNEEKTLIRINNNELQQ